MQFDKCFLLFSFLMIATNIKASQAINYCCSFDTNECNFINQGTTGWTWNTQPSQSALADYNTNPTPNEWLQIANLTTSITSIKLSPTLPINENDVININFYRHTPAGYDDERLTLLVQKQTGAIVILESALSAGWHQISHQCQIGTCCDSYPCHSRFQVKGILKETDDLLAFDDFQLNYCSTPSTTDSASTTPSYDDDELVTIITTSVTIITTVTKTEYWASTYDDPTTTTETSTTFSTDTNVTITP